MNFEFANFDKDPPISESATRPPVCSDRHLALSLLRAGMSLLRRRFAPCTSPSTPASASNCGF
jgi:hypothetical protein